MRDDVPAGRLLRRAAPLALVGAIVAAPSPARAQLVRGYTQVQFQRYDLAGSTADRELWLRTLQFDATRRLAGRLPSPSPSALFFCCSSPRPPLARMLLDLR